MLEKVKEYYGKTIQNSNDLKTSACCASDALPPHVREVLKEIDYEILDKFYGCGSPIPYAIEGSVILDLGSGTGRDVYVASKLVGETGKVIGVDMTYEQLEVARRHVDSQMERFGYSEPNVEFHKGYIEDLESIGIEDSSVDIVISNCVINLSQDKRAVFSEIFRVLKEGGELYFSDVFADRRIPEHLQTDPVFVGECLGGALYIEDFRRMLRELGCPDYRIVTNRTLILDDPKMKEMAGDISFYSMTIRAFKLNTLEDICENYGQTVKYLGTIKETSDEFILDDHHIFKTGEPVPVCGNSASMLEETRYSSHFEVIGDRSTHLGKFPCDCAADVTKNEGSSSGCC
jgi:ubiquinone/menaquinone biosynthesis C-methylase UbiE